VINHSLMTWGRAEAERENTNRPTWESVLVRWKALAASPAMLVACSMAACGSGPGQGALPRGVMSAVEACHQVVGGNPPSMFEGVEQVHLVLTMYAKAEVATDESGANSMAPNTLVWVVDVHAKAVNWNHSEPDGYEPPSSPTPTSGSSRTPGQGTPRTLARTAPGRCPSRPPDISSRFRRTANSIMVSVADHRATGAALS